MSNTDFEMQITADTDLSAEFAEIYATDAKALGIALAKWVGKDGFYPAPIILRLLASQPGKRGSREALVAGNQVTSEDGSHIITLTADGSTYSRATIAHELCHCARDVIDPTSGKIGDGIAGEFLAERNYPGLVRAAGLPDELITDFPAWHKVGDAAVLHKRLMRRIRMAAVRPDFDEIFESEIAYRLLDIFARAAYSAGLAVAEDPDAFETGDGLGPFGQRVEWLPRYVTQRLIQLTSTWVWASRGFPALPTRENFVSFRTEAAAMFGRDVDDGFADDYIANNTNLYLMSVLSHLRHLSPEADAHRQMLCDQYGNY